MPAGSALKKSFSKSQPAGSSKHRCPYQRPCNLKTLTVVEPDGGVKDKKLSRGALYNAQGQFVRTTCPTLLPSGKKFEITAVSDSITNHPRELTVTVQTEALCGKKHPTLRYTDSKSGGEKTIVGTTQKLTYFRKSIPGDYLKGFWGVVNSVVAMGPDTYPLYAETCGVPVSPKGQSISQLIGQIVVYPADLFEAKFNIPLPVLSAKHESKRTKEEWDQKWEKEKEEKPTASQKRHAPKEFEASIKQTDGTNINSVDCAEVYKLYHFATDVRYEIEQVRKWVKGLPKVGFSLDAEVNTFHGEFNAKWQWREYQDDRVFLYINGTLELTLLDGSITLSWGLTSGGMLDATVSMKAGGEIKVSYALVRDDPDKKAHTEPKIECHFPITAKINGRVAWVIKAEGSLTSGFGIETENLHMFTEKGMFEGELALKIDPLVAQITGSCAGAGASKSWQLTDEHKWTFPKCESKGGSGSEGGGE